MSGRWILCRRPERVIIINGTKVLKLIKLMKSSKSSKNFLFQVIDLWVKLCFVLQLQTLPQMSDSQQVRRTIGKSNSHSYSSLKLPLRNCCTRPSCAATRPFGISPPSPVVTKTTRSPVLRLRCSSTWTNASVVTDRSSTSATSSGRRTRGRTFARANKYQ